MRNSPVKSSTRRAVAGGLLLLAAPDLSIAAARPRVVSMLGDSITAGYGLPGQDALPVQLQAQLKALGVNAVVRGAGVSGDTSAGGAGRVDFSVQADTALCVVALGGNDMLQGLKPEAMQANLTRIVRRLKARRIGVLLVGLAAPPAINAGYARAFNAVFPAVARAEGVALYPNLVAGVQGIERLNQHDRIHPNAAGAKIIAQRLAPVVAKALKARP
jgi:acyl-CoA thioesterase-1